MRPVVLLAALSLLVSCKCASPSGGADAGALAEVEDALSRADASSSRRVRARPPARPCAGWGACVEACTAGDAGAACYEASLFALEGIPDAGRDLAAVAKFADAACNQGDGRGCVRASRSSDALSRLPTQCDQGGAEACELLSTLLRQADAGADADVRAQQTARLLTAECERPEPFACARLGSLQLHGRLGPADVKGGVALLDKACDQGVAGACIELALLYARGLPPDVLPDQPRSVTFGRKARALSQE